MKPSFYNVFFPFDGQYILFNTLRGSIFVIDSEIKAILEKHDVSILSEDYKDIFRDNGILVDDKLNEQDTYRLMYEGSKFDTTATSLHVITTYACNLSCTYCYEGKGELESNKMDEKTAKCVIKFIKNLTENNNSTLLRTRLFGGEPLKNMPINLLIARELSKWCEESSIHFSINAITNGTLLTAQNVENLAQYHCSFLVTVDGPKEIHDQRRMYKTRTGTFDDIIEGLHRVKDANRGIVIRINVDKTNRDHIVSLFEFLKDEGFNNAVISIKSVINMSPACLSYNYCMPDSGGVQIISNLYSTARALNFKTEDPEKPSPQSTCSAHRTSYFTIDPYLRLFKCAILPPYKKNSVGTVNLEDSTPIFNHINVDFLSRDVFAVDECRACQFLPLCRGGCPAEIFETQGTTHSSVCRKPGFSTVLQENLINLVRANYLTKRG